MKVDLSELKQIPKENWDALAKKGIFLGHQSVGYNIIDGIIAIEQEIPGIRFNLKETNKPADFKEAVFAHSKVGKNRNPYLKCDDFKRIIENGVGEKANIALFKFCFVDITQETDIKALFSYYAKTMSGLESKYPQVRFLHMTVPLMSSESGIVAKVKKLLGKCSVVEQENIKRDRFNTMMREAYAMQGNLFDLAVCETIKPNGGRAVFACDKKEYPCFAEGWTYDGGHFNEAGKKYIAKEFLLFLVKQIKKEY